MSKTLNDVKLKLGKLWDENPLLCIVVGIAGANAAAKLMHANNERKNANSWQRESKRRVKNDNQK